MDWNDLAQDRDHGRAVVNTVRNLRVPSNAGKFRSGCTIGNFSGRAQFHKKVSCGLLHSQSASVSSDEGERI
jgi:hypothetical protein